MRRLQILIMIFSFSSLFAQNQSYLNYGNVENNSGLKLLGIYLEGNSGTLVSDTTGIYSGNELLYGISYLHSFSKVPWLRMYTRVEAISSINFNYINQNNINTDSLVNPDWLFNGYNGASIGLNRIEAGLYFDNYFYFGIDHRFQINMKASYIFRLPKNQTIRLYSDIQVVPFFIGTVLNPNDPNLQTEGNPTSHKLKEFLTGFEYGIGMGAGWNFYTALEILSDGGSFDVGTQGQAWEVDSLEAFRSNLRLRWNNTIRYDSPSNFYTWAQVRLSANRLIPNPLGLDNNQLYGRTHIDVNLRFGLGYLFNFAAQ